MNYKLYSNFYFKYNINCLFIYNLYRGSNSGTTNNSNSGDTVPVRYKKGLMKNKPKRKC